MQVEEVYIQIFFTCIVTYIVLHVTKALLDNIIYQNILYHFPDLHNKEELRNRKNQYLALQILTSNSKYTTYSQDYDIASYYYHLISNQVIHKKYLCKYILQQINVDLIIMILLVIIIISLVIRSYIINTYVNIAYNR